MVCKRRKLRVNESKSKVMKHTRKVEGRRMTVTLNGELLKEVNIQGCKLQGNFRE